MPDRNNPIIIGTGLAGLLTALHLAPEPVRLVSSALLGEQSSSAWAQGGIAASLGAEDTPALHCEDTLQAGDGLCNQLQAAAFTAAAPALIETLARHGVRFDRDTSGRYQLGLEAAHRQRRIVHAQGDATGREIIRALTAAVRQTPSIEILENHTARRLIMRDGDIAGVLVARGSHAAVLASRQVVIATGGVGGLFLHTTNPAASWGSGIVLAARAGAVIADPEFVQFHPTALDVNAAPMPLISEAVRGEGARLIDETGRHFLQATAVSELSPRDMVARAIWRHLETGHHVFLNVCPVARFAQRFPSIHALCLAAGIDPATQPIPVRPAAHYHMGGIAVDAEGRSTVPGLWACGEAACTGLHGANRLASNSLLEAGVAAQRVAASVVACVGADSPPLPSSPEAVLPAHPNADPIRPILSSAAGLLREQHRLEHAINRLASYIALDGAAADPAVAGLLIAVGALQRRESRGAHYRLDHPHHGTAPPVHTRLTLDDCLKGFA